MPRKSRMLFDPPDEGYYHIISRAVQKEYRLNTAEKQRFLQLLRWLSQVYFVRVATFSLMTTHIHLIVQMMDPADIDEDELKRRFDLYYNQGKNELTKREMRPEEIPQYYHRFASLSKFMQDLKRRFSCWYNEVHDGFGHCWAERFKSVLLKGSKALLSCMMYVELNAVRASIVKEPEKYAFCGLAHLLSGGRQGSWLDLGLLREALACVESYDTTEKRSSMNPIQHYLNLVYQKGMNLEQGKNSIPPELWKDDAVSLVSLTHYGVFLQRIPHFTEGYFLAEKEDCDSLFQHHRAAFRTKKDKKSVEIVPQSATTEGPKKFPSFLSTLCSLKPHSIPST